MCGFVAPLAPKGWYGAVLGNVSLYTTTVAGSTNVAFPRMVVISIVSVSVGSILICLPTLILVVLTQACKLMSVWNWAIMVDGRWGFYRSLVCYFC